MTTPGSLCRRGWQRPLLKGFSSINELKEKTINYYCLSLSMTTIARPTLAMITKTAFIADGGPP
jgi:hypothetical protein